MKGIKIVLALCLIALMICDERSLGSKANDLKNNLSKGFEELRNKLSNKFHNATEDFHFQSKIDSANQFLAGLKDKFDEATQNAKGKLSVGVEELEKISKELLNKAREYYIKVKESEFLTSAPAYYKETFLEELADIKSFPEELKKQLKEYFNKKQEEEKALLELF